MGKVGRLKLGSQGLEVPAQGLGCAGISRFSHGQRKPEEEIIKLIHHAVDSGITILDTADVYGPHAGEILLSKVRVISMLLMPDIMDSVFPAWHLHPLVSPYLPKFQPENLEHTKSMYDRVNEIAARKGCTPGQIALAWLHRKGSDVFPLPGTTKVENFDQNIGALSVELTAEEMAELDSIA